MKTIVLASRLGLAAAACTFPVHLPPQAAPPYSAYGVLPMASEGTSTVALGQVPEGQDFVLTDVLLGSPYARDVVVNADGLPRLCCGAEFGESEGRYRSTSLHLTSGILFPSGSTITVSGWAPHGGAAITVVGYLRKSRGKRAARARSPMALQGPRPSRRENRASRGTAAPRLSSRRPRQE